MQYRAQRFFTLNFPIGVLAVLSMASTNSVAQSLRDDSLDSAAVYRCIVDEGTVVIKEDSRGTNLVSAADALQALEDQIQSARRRRQKVRAMETLVELNSCLSAAMTSSVHTTQALGGAGSFCNPMPLISAVLPGSQIPATGDRIQLGLLGQGYAPGSRMVLALSVNGGQLREHPYTLTHLENTNESSGIVRTTVSGEVATYAFRLFTQDSSGTFYCRSNLVEVEVLEAGGGSPCNFPFSSTPRCTNGDIMLAHDGYLDPDDKSAMLAEFALLLATNNMHRLKHVHFGNPPHTFSAALHERMRLAGQLAVNYGYNGEIFDAHFDHARTVQDMAIVMSRATAHNPVYILASGPFQILHDALTQLENTFGAQNLPYITIVGHSVWNAQAGAAQGYKTQADVERDFPEVAIYTVPDGNHVAFNLEGNTFGFEAFPLLAPIRFAMQETIAFGNNWHVNDMSDAQSLFVLLTGIFHATIPEYWNVMQPLMIP